MPTVSNNKNNIAGSIQYINEFCGSPHAFKVNVNLGCFSAKI